MKIMKTNKITWRLFLAIMVAGLFTFTSCEKGDNVITDPDDKQSTDQLKISAAIEQSTAANLFDELLEISDEALDLFDSYFSQANGMTMGMGNGHSGGMGGGGMTGGMGGGTNGGGNYGMINDSTFIGSNGMGYSSMTGGFRHDTLQAHGDYMRRLSDCVIMTRDLNETEDQVTMTINYGSEGCEGLDGKIRSGKIIITRSGNMYWDGNTSSVITFENYFVDGNQVLGTKTITGSINNAGNRLHQVIINGQIILADEVGTINWEAERTREVVEGSDTHIKSDDVIHITGFSSGTSSDGSIFSSEIIDPLVRIHELGCLGYYVSGIVNITRGADTQIVINYGDGTCDNLAEVTTNGVTEIVELNRRRGN